MKFYCYSYEDLYQKKIAKLLVQDCLFCLHFFSSHALYTVSIFLFFFYTFTEGECVALLSLSLGLASAQQNFTLKKCTSGESIDKVNSLRNKLVTVC